MAGFARFYRLFVYFRTILPLPLTAARPTFDGDAFALFKAREPKFVTGAVTFSVEMPGQIDHFGGTCSVASACGKIFLPL